MNLGSDLATDRSHRLQIDQRHHLRGGIGEGEARRRQYPRRSAQFVALEVVKEGLYRAAAVGRGQASFGDDRITTADGERVGRIVEARHEPGQPLVRINIRKRILGSVRGAAGSNPDAPFSMA